MAEDLIDARGGEVVSADDDAVALDDLGGPADRWTLRSWAYRRRFVAAFAALALVIAAAAGLTWLLLAQTDRPASFSSFAPKDEDPVKRAQEIADYVSGRYLTAPGQTPLMRVEGGEDDKAALPAAPQALAVGTNPAGLVSYEYGNILFFRICGTGPECALGPEQSRDVVAPILARQAHELALYGLKYVPEAAFVITILPPGFISGPDPKALPRAVHFYRRSDLEKELDQPVATTLPGDTPTPATLTPAQFTAIEAQAVRTRYTLTSGVDAANTLNIYTLTPLF